MILKQTDGSRAIAETVALCHPMVICAYPVTPQTRIVEALGAKVMAGTLRPCRFLTAESALSGMSELIGASAAGVRTYTATASQHLPGISEAVSNAARFGLPIVVTVASLQDDHGDTMSQRDSGWIQFYPETSQEAADVHIQAFRIAEELSVPVMVCVDGSLLAHVGERAEIPAQDQVDGFLSASWPRQARDPAEPVPIGAVSRPENLTEARYMAHTRHAKALGLIPVVAGEFSVAFGRNSGGLVRPYRIDDAYVVVVALGSVLSVVKDAVDELRADGMRVGALGITTFRPFPDQAIRDALGAGRRVRRLVVLERTLATGLGGIMSADIRMALTAEGTAPVPDRDLIISTIITGLGGRPIDQVSLRDLLHDAAARTLQPLTFLGLG